MSTRDMHIQGPQINQFNNVSPKKIPRSAFRRDFTRRSTFNQNLLIPVFVDEILPGDDVHVNMTAQVRMSTPIKPLMDNLYFETFWFFVPYRLVWTDWEKFQGQQDNPGDSVAFTIPVLDSSKAPLSTTGFLNQTIYDYLGMPTLVTSAGTTDALSAINCLYNRGYDLIWNEWFRDENLQNSLTIQTGDGPDDPGTYALRTRNKRKDYLTSCLPWAQKGTPVGVSLVGRAPVIGIGKVTTGFVDGPATVYETGSATTQTYSVAGAVNFAEAASNGVYYVTNDPSSPGPGHFPGIWANLAAASPITINALRQTALYQQILELDARGGTRYVESIYSRFGVVSPDFRLQRPELIGQGSTRINVYAVPQTAPTAAGVTPQGNLAAFSATPIQGGHGCRYSATEHGMILGISNVRADLTYQQALPKMYSRRTRLDFYEPLLNGLGEQSVLNSEIMAQGTTDDASVFGYQERSEYRFKNSEITGIFRSNDPLTIQIWHLSQSFGSLPSLNSSFISEAVPMDRVLAVATSTSPAFLMDASYSYNHVRPMPIRSNPGIDRL